VSKALHFKHEVPVTVRFSANTGMPKIADADPRAASAAQDRHPQRRRRPGGGGRAEKVGARDEVAAHAVLAAASGSLASYIRTYWSALS
jgi:hypothetical protein